MHVQNDPFFEHFRCVFVLCRYVCGHVCSIVLAGDLGGGLGYLAIVLENDLDLNSCFFYY